MSKTTTQKESILEEALRLTSGDRRRDYDHPAPNHERISTLWNAYLKVRKDPEAEISAYDAAMMMMLLKVARDVYTSKRDNFVDAIGYIRCAAIIAGYEEQ
jgi:hypothetical protein